MLKQFEYFEDLFHTTLQIQPNLTEDMKINHFHAHLRGLVLETFKNIQRTPTTTIEDILKIFRRKNRKPENSAWAKHSFNRLFFDSETQKFPDFLEQLEERVEKAFKINAHQMIKNLLYAKMPPHLKQSINQAYPENATYDQIGKHLEREMELSGLESDRDSFQTQMTVTKKQNKKLKNPPKNKQKNPKHRPQNQYPTERFKIITAGIAKTQDI